MARRYCFTLELKDDAKLIAEYERCHEKNWPEITQSIRGSGIQDLEIYLFGTRMVVVMEVNEHFSFDAKARADQQNPKVQEWEDLMEVSATVAPGISGRQMVIEAIGNSVLFEKMAVTRC